MYTYSQSQSLMYNHLDLNYYLIDSSLFISNKVAFRFLLQLKSNASILFEFQASKNIEFNFLYLPAAYHSFNCLQAPVIGFAVFAKFQTIPLHKFSATSRGVDPHQELVSKRGAGAAQTQLVALQGPVEVSLSCYCCCCHSMLAEAVPSAGEYLCLRSCYIRLRQHNGEEIT